VEDVEEVSSATNSLRAVLSTTCSVHPQRDQGIRAGQRRWRRRASLQGHGRCRDSPLASGKEGMTVSPLNLPFLFLVSIRNASTRRRGVLLAFLLLRFSKIMMCGKNMFLTSDALPSVFSFINYCKEDYHRQWFLPSVVWVWWCSIFFASVWLPQTMVLTIRECLPLPLHSLFVPYPLHLSIPNPQISPGRRAVFFFFFILWFVKWASLTTTKKILRDWPLGLIEASTKGCHFC